MGICYYFIKALLFGIVQSARVSYYQAAYMTTLTEDRYIHDSAVYRRRIMKKQTKFYHSSDAPKPNRPIHVGAAGIIRNKGKILLERRADSERWAFIGGGMKMEESLEECVQREVREETGLIVERLKLLDIFSYPY